MKKDIAVGALFIVAISFEAWNKHLDLRLRDDLKFHKAMDPVVLEVIARTATAGFEKMDTVCQERAELWFMSNNYTANCHVSGVVKEQVSSSGFHRFRTVYITVSNQRPGEERKKFGTAFVQFDDYNVLMDWGYHQPD